MLSGLGNSCAKRNSIRSRFSGTVGPEGKIAGTGEALLATMHGTASPSAAVHRRQRFTAPPWQPGSDNLVAAQHLMHAAKRILRQVPEVGKVELASRLASCPRCLLAALVLVADESNRPLGRIGWRHEFAKRVKDLLELVACVAAESVVWLMASASVFCSSSASRLARSRCVAASARTRTKVRMISMFTASSGTSVLASSTA
jgi:hypothetical protein